jgi:Na+/phosphate symporter
MNRPLTGLPSSSADVFGGDVAARGIADLAAATARGRARRVFFAAFVFAALGWLATLGAAMFSSETNGIRCSWVAIFPTAFGIAGRVALDAGRTPARAVVVAAVAGVAAVCALAFFFLAVWPSL